MHLRKQVDDDNEAGAVRVVVDKIGMVRDVVIADRWRDSMTPGELGNALCDAANTAITNQLADRLDTLDLDSEPARVVRPDVPDAGGDPTSLVAKALVTETLDLLSRFDRDLETYSSGAHRAPSPTVLRHAAGSRGVLAGWAGGQRGRWPHGVGDRVSTGRPVSRALGITAVRHGGRIPSLLAGIAVERLLAGKINVGGVVPLHSWLPPAVLYEALAERGVRLWTRPDSVGAADLEEIGNPDGSV